MPSSFRKSTRSSNDFWPGFVDALTTLLLVFTFLLSMFMITQFYLSQELSGRDNAIEILKSQIQELSDLLSLESIGAGELKDEIVFLNENLLALEEENKNVQLLLDQQKIKAAKAESMVVDLNEKLSDDDIGKEDLLAQIEEKGNTIIILRKEAEKTKISLSELMSKLENKSELSDEFFSETEKQKLILAELKRKIAAQNTEIEDKETLIVDLTKTQEEILKSNEDRDTTILDLRTKINRSEVTITGLKANINAEIDAKEAALAQLAKLTLHINALRKQLASIQQLLEASEAKDEESQIRIANLGKRLNVALAQKVQELSKYRSDFFGKLREILKNMKNIQIVGDRFVFQSELLFGSGSDMINEEAKESLKELAKTLIELETIIPSEINWVLRIDGHTDDRPIINNQRFPSNWELSAARAISVVRELTKYGTPPNRLVAAGFGEFHPLALGDTDEARNTNRRIELKLTER